MCVSSRGTQAHSNLPPPPPTPWHVEESGTALMGTLAEDTCGAHHSPLSLGTQKAQGTGCSVACQQSTVGVNHTFSTPTSPPAFSLAEQGGDCGWREGEASGETPECGGGRQGGTTSLGSAPQPQELGLWPCPSAWGNFLLGPLKEVAFVLFDVCRKSSSRHLLFNLRQL